MKQRFSSKLGILLLLPIVAIAASCNNSTTPTPFTYTPINITVMHAQVQDFPPYVKFTAIDSVVADSVTYGTTKVGKAQSGNTEVKVIGPGGSLTSTTATIDTAHNTWVIYSGATNSEVFSVATTKTYPATGNAGVRIINAAQNTGGVDVLLGDVTGTSITTSPVDYKGSNNKYVSIPVSTSQLTITKSDGTTMLLSFNSTGLLASQKLYTLVLYGNANITSGNVLSAKLVAEP